MVYCRSVGSSELASTSGESVGIYLQLTDGELVPVSVPVDVLGQATPSASGMILVPSGQLQVLSPVATASGSSVLASSAGVLASGAGMSETKQVGLEK